MKLRLTVCLCVGMFILAGCDLGKVSIASGNYEFSEYVVMEDEDPYYDANLETVEGMSLTIDLEEKTLTINLADGEVVEATLSSTSSWDYLCDTVEMEMIEVLDRPLAFGPNMVMNEPVLVASGCSEGEAEYVSLEDMRSHTVYYDDGSSVEVRYIVEFALIDSDTE